ncbi:MAG TPA: squalene synthase HpnC [Frankiaceae bacterium]|jgi:squalene synthase HpnC|nr:squalene synthase HpnC [Frankiaceae bacterium]
MPKTDLPRPGKVSPADREWLDGRIAALDAARAKRENFPVASRLLRAQRRRHLLDVYVLARLIDDVGDEAPGDRLALLDLIDAELDLVSAGVASRRPTLAPVAALVPAARDHGLSMRPFHDLVAANRMDQEVTRYADFAELRGYCRLSAEPVGHLVLALWDLDDHRRVALSDDVCTGLQIAEHLQDVGEDLAAGRIYLPEDALARHGVTAEMLGASRQLSAADRARIESLLAELAERARILLAAGPPLTRLIPGAARIAMAGFTAGGLAALDAVRAAGADAVHVTPAPKKSRVLLHTVRTLAAAGIRG